MKNYIKKLFFLAFLLLFLFFLNGCSLIKKEIIAQRVLEESFIVEVIDGDTIRTINNETIRLLHVNTPEKNENCYLEAKNRLKELVENKVVWLERDMQDKDKYKRKLRYVFLEPNTNLHNYESFVNLMLIREGYASLLILEPNAKYQKVFKQALNDASQENGCLWGEKSSYFGCFLVEEFHYDAGGDDCENANDEYVKIKNICDSISMNGWTIKDSSRKIYSFKNLYIDKGGFFILYSGSGSDTDTNLFWNLNLECQSIWNNDHDILFLRDNENKLVLQYIY